MRRVTKVKGKRSVPNEANMLLRSAVAAAHPKANRQGRVQRKEQRRRGCSALTKTCDASSSQAPRLHREVGSCSGSGGVNVGSDNVGGCSESGDIWATRGRRTPIPQGGLVGHHGTVFERHGVVFERHGIYEKTTFPNVRPGDPFPSAAQECPT